MEALDRYDLLSLLCCGKHRACVMLPVVFRYLLTKALFGSRALGCVCEHTDQSPSGCCGRRHVERGAQGAGKTSVVCSHFQPTLHEIEQNGRNYGHPEVASLSIGIMQNKEHQKRF